MLGYKSFHGCHIPARSLEVFAQIVVFLKNKSVAGQLVMHPITIA